ncbi:C5a anaphylatoxin chemotactic receptor 1-like [Bolinopsis microptera]|uniref:C5a anaphylatoxin chemotactic receptor 1-like n=1 Tax=Bolinopsis microptera TaxID=2820187 RepID=UPI003079503B
MQLILNHTLNIPDSSRNLADQIIINTWLIFCGIAGISGNGYVLYVTHKYNAIRIDEMSLWFINKLGITDILSTVVMVVPVTAVNFTGNQWIFGDFACIVIAFISRIPFIANILLIVGLNINKLYRVSYPLRSLEHMSNKVKGLWLVTVITLATINPFLGLLFNNFTATLHFNSLASVCRLTNEVFLVVVIRFIIYIIIPGTILIITNTALVIIAFKKTQTSVNKRNIVVVLGVTFQFLIAFIPYTLVLSVAFYIPVKDWVVRGAFSLLYTTCWFNPIVYYLNNPTFKEFTNSLVRNGWSKLRGLQRSESERLRLYRVLTSSPSTNRFNVNTEEFELGLR